MPGLKLRFMGPCVVCQKPQWDERHRQIPCNRPMGMQKCGKQLGHSGDCDPLVPELRVHNFESRQ